MSILYTPFATMSIDVAAQTAVALARDSDERVTLSFNEKLIEIHPDWTPALVIAEFDRLNAEKGGSA